MTLYWRGCHSYLFIPLRLLLTLLVSFTSSLRAEQPESVWTNARWTMDASTRAVSSQDNYGQHALGLDVHKVFTYGGRDIGTLMLQPYFVNFSDKDTLPRHFDEKNTELTWRITHFNYAAKPNGSLNFRVGHFEIPFGLEQNQGTNGTLRQYSFSERGIKADWGVSANGMSAQWEYEISLSRGSGNDISDRDKPYIFSGRIGTPSHKNWIAGVSFFEGRVQTAQTTIRRKRLGLDFAYYYKHWELLSELSYGDDAGTTQSYLLLEASWRNRLESLHMYSQYRFQYQKNKEHMTDSAQNITLGLLWTLTRRISTSMQLQYDTDVFNDAKNQSTLMAQLRYRL